MRHGLPDQRPHPVAYSPAILWWDDGREEVFTYPAFDADRVAEEVMLPGCALMPRALYDVLRGYDEAWNHGATDWMFWVRAARDRLILPMQTHTPTWVYRQHRGFRHHHRGRAVLPMLKREMRRAYRGERRYGDPLEV